MATASNPPKTAGFAEGELISPTLESWRIAEPYNPIVHFYSTIPEAILYVGGDLSAQVEGTNSRCCWHIEFCCTLATKFSMFWGCFILFGRFTPTNSQIDAERMGINPGGRAANQAGVNPLNPVDLNIWLSEFLVRNEGIAGTVHIRRGEMLELAAAVNIPAKVQEVTAIIPRGKGMAGIAFERGEPVQTCNLQEDKSDDVRPGARAVNAKAAVAIPVQGESSEIRAVVGIAFSDERELSVQAIEKISEDSASLPLTT